jgi:hypothetical protein
MSTDQSSQAATAPDHETAATPRDHEATAGGEGPLARLLETRGGTAAPEARAGICRRTGISRMQLLVCGLSR